MGKGSSSPPPAPDPAATAAAQAKLNREGAITQFGLNAVNQNTPGGTLSYKQIGTWDDGTPRYEATTAYTPEGQQLFQTGQRASQQFADIGVNQLGQVASSLGKPLDLSNPAVEGRLMELGRARLDPIFAQRREQTASRLANQGIPPGSEAYTRAMEAVSQAENDAYNQLLLSGRGQSVNEIIQTRQQPLNEISAMLTGTQVASPQFSNTPQSQVAPADITGPTMAKYQGDLNAWQEQQKSQSSTMGSLFGLGGSLLGGWARSGFMMPSDRRLKENIVRVGATDAGVPVYTYRYRGDATRTVHMGVMAQDLADANPDAVAVRHDGMMMVDYGKVR